MKKYFSVYKTLIKLNFSNLVTYRANFINSAISSLAWGTFSIAMILLLTSKTPTVFGWSRNELIFLTLAYNVIVGLFQVFFSRNFENLSQTIHLGRLDSLLVKPMDSQFLITTNMINYSNLIRVTIAIVVGIYLLNEMNLPITFPLILGFIIFSIAGVIILYSCWFLVSTLTIWFTRLSNLIDFLYQITGTARYPQEMIRQLPALIASVLVPLTLIVVVPSKILLQKITTSDILTAVIFAIGLFIASRLFWRFALRYYTSASG